MTTFTATYSPDDNKLRLEASQRLDAETYARVKAAGFKWAPKQEQFIAPMWTPARADLCIELAGEILDDDRTLADRAEDRAERFEDYSEKRAKDAERARRAVSAIADNIPFGQPILVGHHSEKRARRDAAKIENGMRKAVNMWKTSEYWAERAEAAIRHAKYKERPDVRARRIKGIEAEIRKLDRSDKESAATLAFWALVDQPEKWKQGDGAPKTREERAAYVAGRVNCDVSHKHPSGYYWSAYDVLRLPAEDRYTGTPVMTVDEVIADVRASYARATEYRLRWREHYENRLAYERAMLAADGGTVADKTGPEKGGGCRCWASPSGGWSYIQKVNKVTVTVLDNWGNGGRNFTRNIPFDKLAAVMTAAQVAEARAEGRIKEYDDTGRGFYLLQSREQFDKAEEALNKPTPEPKPEPEQADAFAAMEQTLKAGVQVVTAPALFPTPKELAERVARLADVQPGDRVLEPSAGTGMLLGALGGAMFAEGPGLPPYRERDQVHAVEINSALCDLLRREFPLTQVRRADFLQCNGDMGTFDRIVMNPPFTNGEDIKHILHARGMLKPGGRLVAICAGGPRQEAALQPLADSWEELPAGTFAGTNVRAVLLTMGAA